MSNDKFERQWLNYWEYQTKEVGTVYVAYEIDDEDGIRFPAIYEDLAYYLDVNNIAIDYELSPHEREKVYDEIVQEMQSDPRDEPGYYY